MTTQLKILHVSPCFAPAWRYGGLVEAVYQLSRHAAARGATVRVLTTDADGPGATLLQSEVEGLARAGNFKVTCCHRIARQSVAPGLLRAITEHVRWADVVHLHAAYSFPTIPTLLAARLLGRPLLWMPHGALQRWSGSRRPRLKAMWESVCRAAAPESLVIQVTSHEEAVESQARFPRAKVVIIPNGVEVPDAVERAARGDSLRVGYIGRLDEKKGIENLLAACRMLQTSSSIRVALSIAGAGDPGYEASLRSKIAESAIADAVTMIGDVRGKAKTDFFAHQDVMVLPSHTENFGIVVAEALAHGVPVIASRGTPWEGLETHGCGLWVTNDPPALAAAIERIATMPLDAMGSRGARWMAQEFSWERATADLFELYAQMIARAAGAVAPLAEQIPANSEAPR